MQVCIKCGARISGSQINFCPLCNAPLTRERRSFGKRTLLGPGGFKVDEIPEYLARKSASIAMVVMGAIILVFAPIVAYASKNFGVFVWGSLIGLVVGIVLILYGKHHWSKITHIMWTRQALREYSALSSIEEKRSGKIIYQPLEVETLPEDNLVDKKQRIKELLEKLDERLVKGEIKEETYQELKSKYQTKLDTIDSEIRGEASKK